MLCVLVNIRFQVLFHSPPGVLFTFPSQYCFTIGHRVVFRLRGWAPYLLTGFLVSADTLDTANASFNFAYKTITSFGRSSHTVRLSSEVVCRSPNPCGIATAGLASSTFARHYSQNLVWFLFLRVLRCFSSPGSPLYAYGFSVCFTVLHREGFPIRKSADRSLFAAPRGLSQLVTSFVGSLCQGIHLMLLFAWTFFFFPVLSFRIAWVS